LCQRMSAQTSPSDPKIVQIDPERDVGDFHAALAIREVVFIEEQAVPPSIERDEEDAGAYHCLAWVGGHPVGTGRLVALPAPPAGEAGPWSQIGRMAVLAAHRGTGLGAKILVFLEAHARAEARAGILLHAQKHAAGFYEKMGYVLFGEEFEEAGIPHIKARKRL